MSLNKQRLRDISQAVIDRRLADKASIQKRKTTVQMAIFTKWMEFVQPYLLKAAEDGLFTANVPVWTLSQHEPIPDLQWYLFNGDASYMGTVHDAIVHGLTTLDLDVVFEARDLSLDRKRTMGCVTFKW